jgi:parallel beta-helix repeat protein
MHWGGRRLTRVVAATVVATGAALLTAAPAGAAPQVVVLPGQSIQDAVNNAPNGTTIIVKPGVYEQNLTIIGKKNLTIKGPGAQLRPGEDTESTPCDETGGDAATTADETPVSGICIASPDPTDPIRGITIDGLDIRNFTGFGIEIFGGYNTAILRNTLVDNAMYGVAAFSSSVTRVDSNRTEGSGEAGIYIGDSPNANATVVNNESANNLFGIFLRDSQHGLIKNNNVHDNCAGILALADAPGPAGAYTVTFNSVVHNNKLCLAGGDLPFDVQGNGIVLLGAHDMEIHNNDITQNQQGPTSAFGGGVVTNEGLGGTAPQKNRVTNNDFHQNSPADIVWDGTGSKNVFSPNTCTSSIPSGFC